MIKVCRTLISPYMTFIGLRNSVYRAKNIIFTIWMYLMLPSWYRAYRNKLVKMSVYKQNLLNKIKRGVLFCQFIWVSLLWLFCIQLPTLATLIIIDEVVVRQVSPGTTCNL